MRFVQEALGGIVDWDGKNRTVIVAKRPNPGAVTEFTESLDPLGISLIVPDAVDYNEIGGKYVFTAKEALGQYDNEPGTLFTSPPKMSRRFRISKIGCCAMRTANISSCTFPKRESAPIATKS